MTLPGIFDNLTSSPFSLQASLPAAVSVVDIEDPLHLSLEQEKRQRVEEHKWNKVSDFFCRKCLRNVHCGASTSTQSQCFVMFLVRYFFSYLLGCIVAAISARQLLEYVKQNSIYHD